MDLVDALDQAFRHAHDVISGVTPADYAKPTPCAEWTVEDLLTHMVGVVGGLGAAAAGTAGAGTAGDDAAFALDSDPTAQFDRLAAESLDAWRAPGVMDRTVNGGAGPMPGRVLAGINLLDTATHTWDLATASGQPAALPVDAAEAALVVSRETITADIRPGRFGPEVAAPANADATQRLVAFLGRTP